MAKRAPLRRREAQRPLKVGAGKVFALGCRNFFLIHCPPLIFGRFLLVAKLVLYKGGDGSFKQLFALGFCSQLFKQGGVFPRHKPFFSDDWPWHGGGCRLHVAVKKQRPACPRNAGIEAVCQFFNMLIHGKAHPVQKTGGAGGGVVAHGQRPAAQAIVDFFERRYHN